MDSQFDRFKENCSKPSGGINSDNFIYQDCQYKNMQQGKEKMARESHCEIERRRRSKMATYVNELCEMVPACSKLPKKPDKLTILRLAVAHMKTFQSAANIRTDGSYKPSFLTDEEIKHLILEASDGFLFCVNLSNGMIIYCSDTISHVLGIGEENWVDKSIYDVIHRNDTETVNSQLTVDNYNPNNRVLDMKYNKQIIGSRRSFICRMKSATKQDTNQCSSSQNNQQTYSIVHTSGIIRKLPSYLMEDKQPQEDRVLCYMAIGRLETLLSTSSSDLANPDEFITRHTNEGIITFVDSRCLNITGYMGEDLLSHKLQEFTIDTQTVINSFFSVMNRLGETIYFSFQLILKNGGSIWIYTKAYAFLNPADNSFEFIVAQHSTIMDNTFMLKMRYEDYPPNNHRQYHPSCQLQPKYFPPNDCNFYNTNPNMYNSSSCQVNNDRYTQGQNMYPQGQVQIPSTLKSCVYGKAEDCQDTRNVYKDKNHMC